MTESQSTQALSSNHPPLFSMFDTFKEDSLCVRSISKELDNFLEGGLHKGIITQVYGESGCGKSQLAMFFVLGVIERGMPVCYLSTEKQLSWKRLASLAYTVMNEAQFQQAQSCLMYKKSTDFQIGYHFIQDCMKKIKQLGRGGLLVIDSVHQFIKNCFQNNHIQEDAFMRTRKQAEVVNRLRWLAKMSGVAVLLINHAADVIDKRRSSNGRSIVPALGPSWELNIDQNIFLTRKKQIRQLQIISSPKCASSKKRFRIEQQGFVWISEDGVQYTQ